MASPILGLIGAVVPRLKSHAPLATIVGSRVYDHVPRGSDGAITAQYPFVGIASAMDIRDDAECIDGSEVDLQLDVWSRAVGFPEAATAADAVRVALHGYEPDLGPNALVLLEHVTTRLMRDPDGLTSHAVLNFRAIIETP